MDETGKLAATSVISHDITEQLRLAAEVRRTAKVKADFLATMSHEIRTPLSTIVGTAELQMLSEMTPEQRNHMKIIESSGELLLTIVDDILDFSKLAAGKLVIDKNDFNLADLVEGIMNSFGAQVRAELRAGVVSRSDYSGPSCAAMPSRSDRLNNLISNAIKFTPMGEVLLKVTRMEKIGDETAVCFEVKNQGIGIASEVQSRLFQPFVQGDQSTRRDGGTGLGLAISAQLVEQMGGTIELESELGKGSTFGFKLRFEKAAHTAQPWARIRSAWTSPESTP